MRKHKRVTKLDVYKNVPKMKYAIAFNKNESYIIYTFENFDGTALTTWMTLRKYTLIRDILYNYFTTLRIAVFYL